MSELRAPPVPVQAEEQLHWTAKYLRAIVLIVLVLVGLGAYLAIGIPVAVFPSTDFPRIVVGIDNGVMPIDQMQVMVTRPVEEALNSVPGLDHVRSLTSRGSAEINLFFAWNVDMFKTLQYVNAAISRVQPELPPTAKLTANRLTFAAFPIMGYSLHSNRVPPTRLWELANYSIRPQLNRLPGVATVTVQGGEEPEYLIEPDPVKLVETQITVPNILDAVAKSNLIDSPGLIERNHELALSLVSGQAKSVDDLANVVAKTTSSGLPVRLGDLGSIRPSVKPVYTVVSANGGPAVLLNLFRQPESNTVRVASAVYAQIQQIAQALPKDISIKPFYDQSQLVRDAIKSVRDAILIGLLLAAVIVILFLRDWGSSLVAGLVIPATIAITLIALRLLGESFNLMTLGGLAAAVGLVIDDAIVVVENIVLHRDSGQSGAEAVRSALRELRAPLLGSTVTPIVVLLPLIAISGVTGVFFRALAVTVGIALLTSLALALTWTPALSHRLLRHGHRQGRRQVNHGVLEKLTRIYERVIHTCIDRPALLGLFCLALIALSFLGYRLLGTDLLPAMDEGGFILDYLMPAGSSLADTNRVVGSVERMLRAMPEVESTTRRTGLQLGLAAVTEANTGDISVKLKANRTRGVEAVIADARERIGARYPQLDMDFIQILQDMIGDLISSPDPIEIKLFSPDAALLRQWAPKVGDAIKSIPVVKDVKNGIENTISGPAITFRVDQGAAARTGFTPQELELAASALIQGEVAAVPLVDRGRAYPIRVRFPDSTRASLESIRNTILISATGKTATLGTLATVENDPGQTEVRTENLQRSVAVTGRLEGASLGTGIRLVQQAVATLRLPSSIRVEYGGLFEEQQRSFRDLLMVLAAAIVLVFIVLVIEFNTFAAPAAILASALLSTSGVVLALLVTGTTFNISSFMGTIMVVGIVAKNGILLLDADHRFRLEGRSARDAIIDAGERRLRPILMTALATMAGMLPLSLAIGAGSQMLQPLAIAVIGGLVASMVLSLVVTPAAHYFLSPKEQSAGLP